MKLLLVVLAGSALFSVILSGSEGRKNVKKCGIDSILSKNIFHFLFCMHSSYLVLDASPDPDDRRGETERKGKECESF